MEVCFLMVEKAPFGFVTIVTLGPYSVNRFLRLIGSKYPDTKVSRISRTKIYALPELSLFKYSLIL